MVLGELSNNNAQSISANSETTFGDVYRELGPIDINDLVLLEPHFGPRPYWTEARSTSPIGSTCSVIYCIKKWHSTQYTLGVVRSTLRDFPIAIFQSGQEYPVPISQVVHQAFPVPPKQPYSITSYKSNQRVDSDIYNVERLKQDNIETFPTVFFITEANEQSWCFVSEFPDEAIPPFLQGLVVYAEKVLKQSYGLELFTFSMVHISEALLHALYSLAAEFTIHSVEHPGLNGPDNGRQIDGLLFDDDFLQVARYVSHQLQTSNNQDYTRTGTEGFQPSDPLFGDK